MPCHSPKDNLNSFAALQGLGDCMGDDVHSGKSHFPMEDKGDGVVEVGDDDVSPPINSFGKKVLKADMKRLGNNNVRMAIRGTLKEEEKSVAKGDVGGRMDESLHLVQ